MHDNLSWIIPAEGEIELRELDSETLADLADRGFRPYRIRQSRGTLLVVYAQKESDVRMIERLLQRERQRTIDGRSRSGTG